MMIHSRLGRREFVRTAAQAALLGAGGLGVCNHRAPLLRAVGALLGAGGLGVCNDLTQAAEPAVLPCPPGDWQKHGVVLAGDSPRDRWLQNFLCAAEPLEAARWRLWYSINHSGIPASFGIAEGVPGESMTRQEAVLSPGEPADVPLAIGNLPEGWRPVGPIHLRLANGRHRLYFWIHSNPVVRLLAAESDNGRRYRVVDPLRPCLYHPNDRAVNGQATGLSRLAGKQAQLAAGEPTAVSTLVSNDATNIYQLPDGSFEMYTVALMEAEADDPRFIKEDNVPGWIRVIDRLTSADGLHWTDRRRVIVPDDQDPIDQQFYYLAVTHTARGRIGLLGSYRVRDQINDLEWCFSHDGLTWERPQRKPWLERGGPGQPDSLSIYASHALVEHGHRWHLFYTGVNYTHNFRRHNGEPRSTVMHASCASPWKQG